MVTDYLEGALPRGERRRLEAHLADCPHCTEYLAQIRATIRLTGRLGPADLTPEMRDDLGELYRRWRDEG
jgi:anti-sigma factor RsiW